ncbi:MAG: chloride channel protein, partial [Acidobacteriaceae bacterium]
LGGTVGSVAHHLLPTYTATAGAYALVGMGTLFAGIVRAPMTSVLMILETTRDYTVIVPLMISNLVSFFISSRLQKEPIYIALAFQDGIHLPTNENRPGYRRRQVFQTMIAATELLPVQLTVAQALEKVGASSWRTWPVMDQRDVIGVISLATLEQARAQGAAAKPLSDLVDATVFPHVHQDQGLTLALERMGAAHVELLPVVSRADINKLEGVIVLQDLLHAFGIDPAHYSSTAAGPANAPATPILDPSEETSEPAEVTHTTTS